jgi:protocatechuate 3,4-dioxygenase beta subunit
MMFNLIFGRVVLFLAILLFSFVAAHARLKPSHEYMDNNEPANFHLDNNLLNDYTSRHDQNIQPIIIKGRVVDVDHKPVANAKVYAWQVGIDGKYPYVHLRNKVDKRMFNPNSRYSFKGSAVASTDNLGRFVFLSMYPISKKINYINMRVELNNAKLVQTRMYITSRAPRVLYNPSLDYQDNQYYFKIVVPIIKPYF